MLQVAVPLLALLVRAGAAPVHSPPDAGDTVVVVVAALIDGLTAGAEHRPGLIRSRRRHRRLLRVVVVRGGISTHTLAAGLSVVSELPPPAPPKEQNTTYVTL